MYYIKICSIFANKNGMEININDRLYFNIQEYCKYNEIDDNEYINDCIVKQFNIDKFGDLNEILGNKEEKKEKETNKFVELFFNEDEKQFVVKQSLDDDIIIPLSNFKNLYLQNNQQKEKNIENISSNKEINNIVVTKKKRTLQSK